MANDPRTNPKPDATGEHRTQLTDNGPTPKSGSYWLLIFFVIAAFIAVGILVIAPAVFDKQG